MAFIIFFILIEIGVFIVEALLYNWYLKKYSIKELSKWKPSVYAFVAILCSWDWIIILGARHILKEIVLRKRSHTGTYFFYCIVVDISIVVH